MKKTLFIILILVSLGLLVGCLKSVSYKNFNTDIAHHGEDAFISQAIISSPLLSYFRMRLREGSMPDITDKMLADIQMPIDQAALLNPQPQPQITWVGHATVLVQYQGINFLTDPHFSQRAAPVSFAGPKRLVPPAINLQALPEIDFVLISHNHYDHLDSATVEALGNQTHWYVPLGLAAWLEKRGIASDNITELDWWQQHQLRHHVTITMTPNVHWSKRTPFDTNKTLWGGWAVQVEDFSLWFAGDTGYDQEMFKHIGDQLGPFDVALIPIGAYGPRYFMLPQHVDPAQAVQIHKDIKARHSIGIHWGTFQLSHEPFWEPAELLQQEVESQNLSVADFFTIKIGETWQMNP
ncbi:MBL fold metallo-hydrolase [Marinicella sp. W31]|uniref:MBL fold metallo-hydrolase n=1 Tax=Marinicella sp. W31 TaxID=3023713 RepID=UPI0037574BA7